MADQERYQLYLELVRVLAPAEASIPEEIRSSPYADDLADADPALMDRIVEEAASALSAYRQGAGFSVPQWSHLFEADVIK